MKYKTLFRLLIKCLGVSFFVSGLSLFAAHLVAFIITHSQDIKITRFDYYESFYPLFYMLCGWYLFSSGEWIIDKAIPSNRPYCPECGYELSHNTSARCAECGTVIPNITDALP